MFVYRVELVYDTRPNRRQPVQSRLLSSFAEETNPSTTEMQASHANATWVRNGTVPTT